VKIEIKTLLFYCVPSNYADAREKRVKLSDKTVLSKALAVPSAIRKNEFSWDTDKDHRINELTDATDDALQRLQLDGGVNADGGQGRVKSEEVSSITGDVRGSHRSSGERSGSTVVPSRGDVGS